MRSKVAVKYYKFRDPVHGFIEVNNLEARIINSIPFQRLRYIRQLAMSSLVYHGAEHSRFGHSLGVMHLVTKAFRSVIKKKPNFLSREKIDWYEQILRLIALTHDLGHAPFSHASEGLLANNLKHEDYTTKIIKETPISQYINQIGQEYVDKYGEEYNITPELICDIYEGKIAGEKSEFVFLNSFMDSELDCDKMDYLIRDSLYCGVNYGKYDVDRLISSLTAYIKDGIPRLAIEHGGIQAFEEFVLARYFMFIQVYFHRTRRYFDIMLSEALKKVLPNGTYPEDVNEYIKWDDNRVLQLLKDKSTEIVECKRIVERIVFSTVLESKVHPQHGDKQYFEFRKKLIYKEFGEDIFIEDYSADKMPHKIPTKVGIEEEKVIPILEKTSEDISTISDQSYIISSLTEKINIERLYVCPEKRDEVLYFIKEITKQQDNKEELST